MTINLYNTDCMQALRQMSDNEYDLAIVDPPYGLSESGAHTHTTGRHKLYSDVVKMKQWDTKPPAEYFDELRRVSRHQIIWGMNYFVDMLPASRCFIVWDKHLKNRLSFSEAEIAYASFNRMSKIVSVPAHQPDRIHRCQKPVQLYEWLLHNYLQIVTGKLILFLTFY